MSSYNTVENFQFSLVLISKELVVGIIIILQCDYLFKIFIYIQDK
jgi:hypothetical protein